METSETVLAQVFSRKDFRIKGYVEKLSRESGLTKSLFFRILTKRVKKYMNNLPIEPYFSLPSVCPFLIYDLQVRLSNSACLFETIKINQCYKMFKKTGIPRKVILARIPRERWIEIGYIPAFIKTKEDFRRIKCTRFISKAIRTLIKPYLQPDIFLYLLRYFPQSLLLRMDEDQMHKLLLFAKQHPYFLCFRQTFGKFMADIGYKPVKQKSKKNDIFETPLKQANWTLTEYSEPRYCVTKWKTLISEENKLNFDASCPMWNVNDVKRFCQDHSIPTNINELKTIRQCIFGCIAYDRERFLKKSGFVPFPKASDDMKKMLKKHGLLGFNEEVQSLYSPNEIKLEERLVNMISKRVEKLIVLDSNTSLEGMYDHLIDYYIKKYSHGFPTVTIIVPNVSDMHYFIGKMEATGIFEREKPKRGRKKKTNFIIESKIQEPKKIEHSIYYLTQWESVYSVEPFYMPEEVVLFNAQDMDTIEVYKALKFLEKFEYKLDKLTIIGSTSLWTIGIPLFFNSLVEITKPKKIKPSKRSTNPSFLFDSKHFTKKCAIYENEDLFAESLVEWMKNNGVKWRSKILLFTNPPLREYLCMLTNNNVLKLGLEHVIYIDSLVRVEPMGLYGILKKAYKVTDTNALVEHRDLADAIFTDLSRYILKIEDYYTKIVFNVDTKYQECTSYSFVLVKDCIPIPYEFVILIADNTTTKQDMKRAVELSKGNYTIYYRNGLELNKILEVESNVPVSTMQITMSKAKDNILSILTNPEE